MKVNEAEAEAEAETLRVKVCQGRGVVLPTLLAQGTSQGAPQGRVRVRDLHIARVAVVFHPTEWKQKKSIINELLMCHLL